MQAIKHRLSMGLSTKPSESCSYGIIAMRVSHEKIELDTAVRRLYELVRNTYVSSFHTVLVDDVLVAWGCRPHQCPCEQGGIAIEVATGRPYAATCSRENGVRVFGGGLSDLPEPFQRVGARNCISWNGTDDWYR